MRNQWDLYVKNFGRIQEATITISPFMMFVGKNNTGKSYLMLLLWGILSEFNYLMRHHLSDHPDYKKLVNDVETKLYTVGGMDLGQEEQNTLLNIFNDILNQHKDYLLKRIFNFPVTIEKLEIYRNNDSMFAVDCFGDYENMPFVPMQVINMELNEKEKLLSSATFLHNEHPSAFLYSNSNKQIADSFLFFVLSSMIKDDFYERAAEPLYFPASRTGFMQTYRAIIGNVFDAQMDFQFSLQDNSVSRQIAPPGTNLTLPVSNFLSRLLKINIDQTNQEKYKSELIFLRNELFNGNLATNEQNQIVFTPSHSKIQYPLHVTSSLVAELAPLSLFLSSDNNPKLWIIEEIEAHLHTELQLKIARFLFRLINKDKSIWITTHSDTLAQQINNLLTIAQRNDQTELLKKLNYSEQDIPADLNQIHAYQFEDIDGNTVITKLELGLYGFEMKTFNDTLEQLIKETNMIQNYEE